MTLSKTSILSLAGLLILNLWSYMTDFVLMNQLLVASLIIGMVLFSKSKMEVTGGIRKSRQEQSDRRSAA
ncbi:hypothetical protein [Robiginitalea sp. IMCC43444]|uniref:hypothetical protein n=1 Tax=Robiginitalea sp. IMCC43444 TaxID=3459121 RepID=UPI004041B588